MQVNKNNYSIKLITVIRDVIIIISFICQHATRHLPHQSAQFHVHRPALRSATPVAAHTYNRSTMHFRLHLLFQPRAHMTAQMHVHISDAPLTAATTTTAQSITTTVNVTTPQKQLR